VPADPSTQYFAIAPRGLEALLGAELTAQGAQAVRVESGGASFAGDLGVGYRANLHSRLASRILWQVARAPYRDEDDLYALARGLRWEEHFSAHQTLRLDINASGTSLRSLEFALLKVKDGIVDRLREATGQRPDIDRQHPDVRVFIFVDATHVTLYLDLSGEPLFKRGWRADKGEAPLKENLAAGLLQLAGWTPAQPLVDPFCGSGTILIEAALAASRMAPGMDRAFAFERLRSFDAALWQRLRDEARAQVQRDAPMQLAGSDISTRVIDVARQNLARAGLSHLLGDGRLHLAARDARVAEPLATPGLIISNPPYGEQSAPKSASVPALMRNIGQRLKQSFAGWQVWMLTSDRELPRQLRLQEKRKTVLFNGALECRFFRFDLVQGAYRPRGRGDDDGGTPSPPAQSPA
jgi:putative N6-adenine-specific DNA methylase